MVDFAKDLSKVTIDFCFNNISSVMFKKLGPKAR